MAKVSLPGYDNKQFADFGAVTGGVAQPPLERMPMGLLSFSAPSYLAPQQRGEEFLSARDSLNRGAAYARAFAKIDFPQFQPHDETDWSFLRAAGAVAGTMADYSFQKMKERQDQEDLIYVAETRGQYQRQAQRLWSEKYENKLTGYAAQNEELNKAYQEELNGLWDTVSQRTPAREAARVAALRARADMDSNLLTHVAEKTVQFEGKYALKAADQGLQQLVSEAQQADEFGVGPARAKAISQLMSGVDAYRHSGRGNALLAEELRDKGLREMGKAILMADAKRSPEQFLSKWAKGDYEVQVGLGLPGPSGEPPARINLMTDEVRTLGTTHAATVRDMLERRAQAAANQAAVAAQKNFLAASNGLSKNLAAIDPKNFTTDADFAAGVAAIQKNLSVMGKHQDISHIEGAVHTEIEAISAYRQLSSGQISLDGFLEGVERLDPASKKTLVTWKDRKGQEHTMSFGTGAAQRVRELVRSDIERLGKDAGAFDAKLQPRFDEAYRAAGINEFDPRASAVRAKVREDHASTMLGKGVYAMHTNFLSVGERQAAKRAVDSAQTMEEKIARVQAIAGTHGTSAVYDLLDGNKETAIVALAATAASKNPGILAVASDLAMSAQSGKAGDQLVLTPQEKTQVRDTVLNILEGSPWAQAQRTSARFSSRSIDQTRTVERGQDALVAAAIDMKANGMDDSAIQTKIRAFTRALSSGVVSDRGYLATSGDIGAQLNLPPDEEARRGRLVLQDIMREDHAAVFDARLEGDPEKLAGMARRHGWTRGIDNPEARKLFVETLRRDIAAKREGARLVYTEGTFYVVGGDGKRYALGMSNEEVISRMRAKSPQDPGVNLENPLPMQ